MKIRTTILEQQLKQLRMNPQQAYWEISSVYFAPLISEVLRHRKKAEAAKKARHRAPKTTTSTKKSKKRTA
jgi:hypothetical protein